MLPQVGHAPEASAHIRLYDTEQRQVVVEIVRLVGKCQIKVGIQVVFSDPERTKGPYDYERRSGRDRETEPDPAGPKMLALAWERIGQPSRSSGHCT
jgi:hypothetical protein